MSSGPQWTEDDDEKLRQLVDKHGPRKWAVVARALKTKTSKQCRRRWINVLSAEMKTTDWSPQEDALLVEGHRLHGNKWSMLAGIIGGRTDNAVKNRWAALCKKDPQLERNHILGNGQQHFKGASCRGPNGTKRRSLQKIESMEESEAEMSDSETEASDEEDDITSDISDTEGPVQAPASPRLENADSSFRHGALPPEDGVHPGTYGLDASSGEGLPREVIEDEDMEDADDVPELFLPEPSRPPGPRPPYRGLSITIPPEEEIDPGGGGGNPALVCSPGLTIRIWKDMLSPRELELVDEINCACSPLLRIDPVPDPPSAAPARTLQWGAGAEASVSNAADAQFDSLLGFLSTVPKKGGSFGRLQYGEPLRHEHRRLLHMILSSAGATSSSNTSAHGHHGLQSTQSTAADVAARLLFRHNPSMSLDRILNSSFGSTYNMDSGDWTTAAVAAAVADSPNPDILLSPHCSEEELTMLLEALSQPSDVTAATSSAMPPTQPPPAPVGLHVDKGPLEKSPLGREAALNTPVMG